MSEIILNAQVRKGNRKQSKNVRREGFIPGIFYGHGEDSIPIQTTLTNLRPLVYTSDTHIVTLKLDNGTDKMCIIRDIQLDPITDKIIHFDLLALKEGEKVTIDVPIILKGSAAGVKEGGMVQQALHRLEMKCFPKDIPEHIEVDITPLNIGDSVHVSDIKLENVEVLESEDSTIVSVVPPTILKEPTEVTEGVEEEPTEPEVVKRGKKEEEEESPAEEPEKK